MRVRDARDQLKERREIIKKDLEANNAFFSKLDAAKIAELNEKVKLRLQENEMRPKVETDEVNLRKINKDFERAFPDFQNKLVEAEQQRLDAASKMIEMRVMLNYIKDPNYGGR